MPGGKEIKKDEKIEREPLDMGILDKSIKVTEGKICREYAYNSKVPLHRNENSE